MIFTEYNFRSLRNKSNVGKVVIKLSNSVAINEFNVKKTTQFLCDSKNSYLVYGKRNVY